ncbi:hypothetical protein LSH36_1199g00003 [Paralvinella palmiformis]|uniref:RING-type domain-containing protein n=1 Tax=Paralvinella palmiformis TaxID=53620 RepID=A0AAD9MPT8_9ANNE|nr:hypothetical protein LSH36_1199g00003 [Paralvinella palmiformis]
MAATNAINLYINTCRYVIQSNPYDPDTWPELHRYLPYLRQSLSCCVCSKVLHIPMGLPDSPCQHHVCKECIGGKMRFKPTCSWCKDSSQYVENSILRTVIQCFKKLCEYLGSSAVAVSVGNINTVDTNILMTAINDGMHIKDDYVSPTGPQFVLFPPKLHKINSRRTSKEERTVQRADSSNQDKGEGRLCVNGDESVRDKKLVGAETKVCRKRKRISESGSRNKAKQPQQQCPNGHGIDLDSENRSILSRNSIYETVAAEHDYNRNSAPNVTTNSVLKVRIRKVEGDHESLIRRPKLVAEAMFTHDVVTNSLNADDDFNKTDSLGDISNNNDTLQGDKTDQGKNKPSGKRKITGCRCGLATPNPGKLTCCGQRCPCYSSFKGCVDCKCRGCRNPRGDRPSPHSLKAQLTSQSRIPLTSPSPQLILTPIKMDNNNI